MHEMLDPHVYWLFVIFMSPVEELPFVSSRALEENFFLVVEVFLWFFLMQIYVGSAFSADSATCQILVKKGEKDGRPQASLYASSEII